MRAPGVRCNRDLAVYPLHGRKLTAGKAPLDAYKLFPSLAIKIVHGCLIKYVMKYYCVFVSVQIMNGLHSV